MNLQEKIDAAKAKAAAALADEIAKLECENTLASLCPDGFAPKGFSYSKYCDVDTIDFEVNSAAEIVALLAAWHEKYGAFLTIGEYRKGCVTITAYPWDEYADVAPSKTCDDGVEVSNHAGRGFNSVAVEFYPNIPGNRVRVQISEKFRAGIHQLHGYVYADYNRSGDVIYNSIRKTAPAAFRDATFTVTYGSGREDSADFCGVFTFDKIVAALQPKGGE